MSSLVTMTLDELRKKPLSENEKKIIHNAKPTPTDDFPMLTEKELQAMQSASVNHPEWFKIKKSSIQINIDVDVLEWFKSQGKGYQTRINATLRQYAFGD